MGAPTAENNSTAGRGEPTAEPPTAAKMGAPRKSSETVNAAEQQYRQQIRGDRRAARQHRPKAIQ